MGLSITVTKSGSNLFHGTAYWFFRNQAFNARDRYATFNPDESRHQFGASVSGAIVKDKLFFFLNADLTRRNFPMVDSINTSGVVDPNAQAFIGCGSPATAAQCAAINALLPRFYGSIPRTAHQDLYFAKLDYRLTDRNTLSASLNYMRFVSPNGIQTGATSTSGSAINSNGDDTVRVRNGRFSWTAIPKSNFVNEFRFGWSTDRQADTFNDSSLGQGLGFLQVSVAGATIGPANYLPRVEPNEQRFQFVDNATWTKGKHIIKFGADIATTEDYTYYISNVFGSYSLPDGHQLRAGLHRQHHGATNGKHWNRTRRPSATRWSMPPSTTTASTCRTSGASPTGSPSTWARATNTPAAAAHALQPGLSADRAHSTGQRTWRRAWASPTASTIRPLYAPVTACSMRASSARSSTTCSPITQCCKTHDAELHHAPQLAAGPTFPTRSPHSPPAAHSASTLQFLEPGTQTPYSEQGTLGIERQIGRDLGRHRIVYLEPRDAALRRARLESPGASNTSFTYTIDDANGAPVGTYTTPIYLGPRAPIRATAASTRRERRQQLLQRRWRYNCASGSRHGLAGRRLSYTWAHEIDDGQSNGSGTLFFSSASNWTYNGNSKRTRATARWTSATAWSSSFVWAADGDAADGRILEVRAEQLAALLDYHDCKRPATDDDSCVPRTLRFRACSSTSNLWRSRAERPRVPFWPWAVRNSRRP